MWRSTVVHILWIPCLIALTGCISAKSMESRFGSESYFYKPAASGSESLYQPLYNNLSYAQDSLQLSRDFSTDNFNHNLDEVWHRLTHPGRIIEDDGGLRRFISREIFPIDPDHFEESGALLPNYALHLLGGGIAFRKDVEWFRSHDYPFPILASVTLAMTGEVIQEAFENEGVIGSDAIADVYIFRPLGLWLFSSDRVARYIQRTLEPAIWPTLHSVDLNRGKPVNTGISYIYRPPKFKFGNQRVFVYTGLNTLLGLSHHLSSGDTVSWGIGVAINEVTSQRKAQVNIKTSLGLFYDRNNSLIWSAVLNDTGDTRFRLNVYPRSKKLLNRAGFFLRLADDGDLSAGILYRLPFGVAVTE